MSNLPQSYYAASVPPASPRLPIAGAQKADICIIGAGYTGLAAALQAAETGARVIVLEAQNVGFGASGRNGGQIHSGLRKDQSELESWLGPIHARDLWALSEEAKAFVHLLVARHGIACDLKAGIITAAHDRAALRALAAEADHLKNSYGYGGAKMLSAAEISCEIGTTVYRGGKLDRGGGHLHPLLYARGLATAAESAGVTICESSQVLAIEQSRSGVEVRCAKGCVTAGRAILATDSYTGCLVPKLDRYIGKIESFIAATAPLSAKLGDAILVSNAAVADTRHVLDYYRKSADGRLLFAGREAYFGSPGDIAALVRPRMLRVFPQLRAIPIEFAWSGTVGITVTRLPHFGKLSDRILFGYGYSGQGVSLATLGGRLLAEAASGREERFSVFARVPARPFPGGRMLRKPLVAAALLAYRIADTF